MPAPESLAQRTTWVEHSGFQVHLLLADEQPPSREGHFAVVLDDYEGVIDSARQHGYEVDPRSEHWGSPRAFLRDPAGHRVEVMAFPPGHGTAETARRTA